MNPTESRRRSRPLSANSSRKVSPLLMGKKASPMLGTHPVVTSGTEPRLQRPADALRLPDSTLDTTSNDVDLLYSVSGVTSVGISDNEDDGGSHAGGNGRAEKDNGLCQRGSTAQKRRRMEKKQKKKPSTVATTKTADVAVVQSELQRLSSLFSRVEFQLQMDKAPMQNRSTLFPRDIGTLLLWAVPSPVPLIESPKIFAIKNRSRLRDCVVIFVNGWSYDMMMCTGVGVKHDVSASNGGEESDSKSPDDESMEEVWNEKICNALLQPIRQNSCWARQASDGSTNGGVQYAPLFIPNMKNTLEQDLFWRNDAPRTPRETGPSRRQPQQQDASLDANAVDVSHVSTSHEEARGVGNVLKRAKEIVSNSSSPVTAQPSDAMPPTSAAAVTSPTSPSGASAEIAALGKDGINDGQAASREKPLWGDRALLEQYALHLPEHCIAFEDLGFTLSVPTVAVSATGAEGGAETGEGKQKGAKEQSPAKSGRAKGKRTPDPEWSEFDLPAATSSSDPADAGPRVFAFDCEMVLAGNYESQLARATLVNVRTGELAFDMLVKPHDPVTNYLTKFSGIDEDMLRDVTNRLADCQRELKRYIDTETFVVGHSLENDFKACKMLPNCRVLDSAWLYPHPSGLPYKNALKFLAMRYLGRRIQQGSHDSGIDALASADLVYMKLERGPSFGVRERVSVIGLMTSTASPPPGESRAERIGGGGADGGDDSKRGDSSAKKSSSDVSIHLFDDAQVLTTIMPSTSSARRESAGTNAASTSAAAPQMNLGAVNAIPTRHDADATRKVIRALQRRKKALEEDSGRDSSPSSAPGSKAHAFSFMWVQLTETRDVDVVMRLPKTLTRHDTEKKRKHSSTAAVSKTAALNHNEEEDVDADSGEAQATQLLAAEEEQLRRVAAVNDRVLQIIEACPDETLVVVLSGDCSVGMASPNENKMSNSDGGGGHGEAAAAAANESATAQRRRWVCNNQYSQAQGAAFFFVKDSAAPGPVKEATAAAASSEESSANTPRREEAIDTSSPACQAQ